MDYLGEWLSDPFQPESPPLALTISWDQSALSSLSSSVGWCQGQILRGGEAPRCSKSTHEGEGVLAGGNEAIP